MEFFPVSGTQAVSPGHCSWCQQSLQRCYLGQAQPLLTKKPVLKTDLVYNQIEKLQAGMYKSFKYIVTLLI